MIERKGFAYLIDAMALLRTQAPFLMIGGRGPLKEQLQHQIQQVGISDSTKFLEYIPDESIPAYFSAADVFVLPSIVDQRDDTEGLGVVLLEALACATPCVASRVGGIPDVITDDLNGYLVEPGDPIAIADRVQKLLADELLRHEMGKYGRQVVEQHFSWEAKAREILQVYGALLRRTL
jgi:glycosyltransferase involved in cell wall biosynthesis